MGKANQGCIGFFAIVAIIAVAGAAVAMFSGDTDDTCMAVPDTIMADIGNGLPPGVSLENGQMARAEDRGNVWFVAARVDGAVGVWATSRIDAEGRSTDTGLIYSVGDVANDVSNWGDGGRTDAELSVTEDAAQQAVACVGSD